MANRPPRARDFFLRDFLQHRKNYFFGPSAGFNFRSRTGSTHEIFAHDDVLRFALRRRRRRGGLSG